mmetsp:Transcript_678/g.1492  ORF Transcript_678/g.1492 Transcript_678/m.1492 type:complete len:301 (+) Transcript_678:1418-2320(+)
MNLMMDQNSPTRFWSGVPDRHQRDPRTRSAKAACAVLFVRVLMRCASSRTTRPQTVLYNADLDRSMSAASSSSVSAGGGGGGGGIASVLASSSAADLPFLGLGDEADADPKAKPCLCAPSSCKSSMSLSSLCASSMTLVDRLPFKVAPHPTRDASSLPVPAFPLRFPCLGIDTGAGVLLGLEFLHVASASAPGPLPRRRLAGVAGASACGELSPAPRRAAWASSGSTDTGNGIAPELLALRRNACVAALRIALSGFKTMFVSVPPIFIFLTASSLKSAFRCDFICFSVLCASGPQKYFWW